METDVINECDACTSISVSTYLSLCIHLFDKVLHCWWQHSRCWIVLILYFSHYLERSDTFYTPVPSTSHNGLLIYITLEQTCGCGDPEGMIHFVSRIGCICLGLTL